jgi:prefoldin alpha subunit
VPLTNSLYVPGKLSDPDHVIVDVGTGYFVQKVRGFVPRPQLSTDLCAFQTRAQAVKHYSSKVDYIRSNLDTLEETISKKRDNVNSVVNVMQAKLQQQQQQPAS